ncbi:MAG: peptide-methionine (S)-S-oxide reductase [Arachidicoccus sp.]|nr:peptide-methionine (S)-S-oxide reductase [Arachidicoccus sp.]
MLSGQSNKALQIEIKQKKVDTATFAAGCFWCVEAQFKELKGVISVTSGFTGGTVANPSYRLVCIGTTDHADASNIVFNPKVITYDQLYPSISLANL